MNGRRPTQVKLQPVCDTLSLAEHQNILIEKFLFLRPYCSTFYNLGGGINLRAVTSARSIFEFSNSWIIDATLSPWPYVAISTQQPVVTVADISLTIGIVLYIDEGYRQYNLLWHNCTFQMLQNDLCPGCSDAVSTSCGSNGVCNATLSMCQCSPQYFGVYCTRCMAKIIF